MILYDFWADWCSPCKMMNPILDELESDFPNVEIKRINIEETPELQVKYGIQQIPTYILFEDETETDGIRVLGAMPKHRFYKELGLS